MLSSQRCNSEQVAHYHSARRFKSLHSAKKPAWNHESTKPNDDYGAWPVSRLIAERMILVVSLDAIADLDSGPEVTRHRNLV